MRVLEVTSESSKTCRSGELQVVTSFGLVKEFEFFFKEWLFLSGWQCCHNCPPKEGMVWRSIFEVILPGTTGKRMKKGLELESFRVMKKLRQVSPEFEPIG